MRRTARVEVVRLVFKLRCQRCNLELAQTHPDDVEEGKEERTEFTSPREPIVGERECFSLDCPSCGTENIVPRKKLYALFAQNGVLTTLDAARKDEEK